MKVLYYKGFIIKKTSRNKYFSIARSLIYYYCKRGNRVNGHEFIRYKAVGGGDNWVIVEIARFIPLDHCYYHN